MGDITPIRIPIEPELSSFDEMKQKISGLENQLSELREAANSPIPTFAEKMIEQVSLAEDSLTRILRLRDKAERESSPDKKQAAIRNLNQEYLRSEKVVED